MNDVHGVSSCVTSTQTVPSPRLVTAAHEFEAQMMKELLQALAASTTAFGDDSEEAGSGSMNALGEFSSEALGRGLSDHGGFGIAASIIEHFSPRGNPSRSVTSNAKAEPGCHS